MADHVLAGLALLGGTPLHDPAEYLLSHLATLGDHERPPEQLSALEGVRAALRACRLTGTPYDRETHDGILCHIRSFRHPDGGFGAGQSTLGETADALEVLTLLGRPEEAARAAPFIASAERPEAGFFFLEPVAALVRACHLLGRPLRSPGQVRSFVLGLRHHAGGFVRSRFGGAPTLEFSYLAIETLVLLDRDADPSPRGDPPEPLRYR